jgi:hypothetical protein
MLNKSFVYLFILGIHCVVFYRHPTTDAVLNLIEATHANPAAAIFKFHSTFVMNYMTHNALLCFYPQSTEDHVGLVNTCNPDLSIRMQSCLSKYDLRGFQALDRGYDWKESPHDCDSYAYCG